jgi:hypothetical protein
MRTCVFVGRQLHIGKNLWRLVVGGLVNTEQEGMWKEVTYRDVNVTLQKGRNK